MSTWIEEGIAALEVMKAEIDGALGTLRKLKDGHATPPATTTTRAQAATATATAEEDEDEDDEQAAPDTVLRSKDILRGSNEIVQARDSALLERLARSPASIRDLIAALPPEANRNQEQRENDCRNALTRLKAKGKVKFLGDLWLLA